MYRILLVKVEQRVAEAVDVQSILTEYGCCIKTRLGLHEASPDFCSPSGLIFLQLAGNQCDMDACLNKLNALNNVVAKYIEI